MLAPVRAIAFAAVMLAGIGAAAAQSAVPTDNWSVSITTGNTFQQVQPRSDARRSLTIQNNNASDSCYVNIDGSVIAGNTTATSVTTKASAVAITAAKASVLLSAGQSYTRYYPYVPSGPIVVTCATTASSLYVDMQ